MNYQQLSGGMGTPGTDYQVDGVRITVEGTSDLTTSSQPPAQWVELLAPPVSNGDGTERVSVRTKLPLGLLGPRAFLRVKVSAY